MGRADVRVLGEGDQKGAGLLRVNGGGWKTTQQFKSAGGTLRGAVKVKFKCNMLL
jgi:hypothetical protein